MINLRFHIVSLVAVFLALGIGIAVGATVVDRGLVNSLNSDIARFDRQLEERGEEISALKGQVGELSDYAEETEARSISGRLSSMPILVVTTSDAVAKSDNVVRALVSAGSRVQGTLVLNDKARLETDDDFSDAAVALNAASQRKDTLQFLLRQRIVDAITKPTETEGLASLQLGGFITFRGFSSDATPPVLSAFTKTVMVTSGATASPVDGELLEVTQMLAEAAPFTGVVTGLAPAVEQPSSDAKNVPLAVARSNRAIIRRFSTVDHVDTRAGRLALVFALEDLRRNVVGQYGKGPGAERLVPGQ